MSKEFGNQPQPSKQPEHTQPLQGRVDGRQSRLQVPTTVDGSEQAKSDGEKLYGGNLEEMRAVYEKEPNLFANRAMQALNILLEETIPHVERRIERDGEESRAYVESSGHTMEKMAPYSRLLQHVRQNGHNQGYKEGLKTAFLALYEHITGEPAYLYPPGEEPAHLKPEEGGRQQP